MRVDTAKSVDLPHGNTSLMPINDSHPGWFKPMRSSQELSRPAELIQAVKRKWGDFWSGLIQSIAEEEITLHRKDQNKKLASRSPHETPQGTSEG